MKIILRSFMSEVKMKYFYFGKVTDFQTLRFCPPQKIDAKENVDVINP